jgi:outer membrane protein TolC
MRKGYWRTTVGILLGVSAAFTARAAEAQPAPSAPPTIGDETTLVPVPNELLQTSPSGLTADQVGARAVATSFTAKAYEQTLRAAAARVDQAWSAYLPRLTGTARYTRLSSFTPPSLSLGPSGIYPLYTTDPPGQPLKLPDVFSVDPNAGGGLSFPLVLDNWLLQANITVPISDYFLRINQNYSAATRSQDAARFDLVAQRANAATNGKLAYFTWLRARGAVIVAVQSLNDQKTHLKDAKNQFSAGKATNADVLRATTAVASAELAVEHSRNLADLAAKQMRVALHAKDDEAMVPGEGIEDAPPPFVGNVKQLELEALSARYELKSAEANAAAARDQADAYKAGRYPSVSAFADGIYANPNPRRFPATNEWFPTWDVGAQLVWSPNDYVLAGGQVADFEARASAIEANKEAARDGILVEVTQAYQGVREADFSVETTKRELASAEEAYRVARELFNAGVGTSTTLHDAETELTRARLDQLNAKVDARTARIRLDHALGRDTRAFVQP